VQPSQGPGSRYQIITPAAVAAVRGTKFRVSADAQRPVARSEVTGGRVDVSGTGASQLVTAGYGTITEAGQPPQPPRELLPAPDLAELPERLVRLPVQLRWKSIDKAAAYRVQVAANDRFDVLLVDETSRETRTTVDLPDGDYALRVRAIDADRLEGLDATRAFSVAARPEPPELMGPGDNRLIRETRPEFTWSADGGGHGWRLQLARDPRFGEMVEDIPGLREPRFRPAKSLAPGDWYWRVASLREDDSAGPFSDARFFRFSPLPPGPELVPPQIGEDEMAFHWQPVAGAAQYHFQLARDPDFEDIIAEQRVVNPGVVIPRPSPERYYFRARTLNADGDAGPFGITYEVYVPPTSYWPILFVFIPLLL
jgi:hypothetical protein